MRKFSVIQVIGCVPKAGRQWALPICPSRHRLKNAPLTKLRSSSPTAKECFYNHGFESVVVESGLHIAVGHHCTGEEVRDVFADS
jgi:hypothetical protein